MNTHTAQSDYQAYLVRVWRDGQHGAWRASVTHVATGEARRFGTPQQLWAYILAQLAAPSADQEASSE